MQSAAGGDALLGRALHPLLTSAGYEQVTVRPRTVYADSSRPALVGGFIRSTFMAVVDSVREQALEAGLVPPADWDRDHRPPAHDE